MKRIFVIILVCVFAFSITACSNNNEDTIKMPTSSRDLRGENYQDVIEQLESAGFTNIQTVELDDLITGWLTKDGSVKQIDVDGETDFDVGAKFSKDVKITITYHTFPSNNDESDDSDKSDNSEEIGEFRTETERWLASDEYAKCKKENKYPVIPGNNPYGIGINESTRNKNIYYLNCSQKGPWGSFDSESGEYEYHIPSGTYLVMNTSNPKQYDTIAKGCNVYITSNDNEEDWTTYSFTQYGETKEIIIPDGYYVSLTVSAIITLELIPQ